MSRHVRRARRCRLPAHRGRWRLRASALSRTIPPLHLVLVGDSIFDNATYTGGDPDVTSHLQRILPAPWHASRVAVDGATTASIPGQVVRLPRDATHLALSVGGNDALGHLDLLSMRVDSMADAWDLIHSRLLTFERNYIDALEAVLTVGLPTIVCTIYNGNLPDETEARRATVALRLFNDVIVRAAISRRCPVVDLRLLCTDSADYANPIEPSGQGGAKIARALARVVGAMSEPEPSAYNPHGRRV